MRSCHCRVTRRIPRAIFCSLNCDPMYQFTPWSTDAHLLSSVVSPQKPRTSLTTGKTSQIRICSAFPQFAGYDKELSNYERERRKTDPFDDLTALYVLWKFKSWEGHFENFFERQRVMPDRAIVQRYNRKIILKAQKS